MREIIGGVASAPPLSWRDNLILKFVAHTLLKSQLHKSNVLGRICPSPHSSVSGGEKTPFPGFGVRDGRTEQEFSRSPDDFIFPPYGKDWIQ